MRMAAAALMLPLAISAFGSPATVRVSTRRLAAAAMMGLPNPLPHFTDTRIADDSSTFADQVPDRPPHETSHGETGCGVDGRRICPSGA